MDYFILYFGAATLFGVVYSPKLSELPWRAVRLRVLAYSSGLFFGMSVVHDTASFFGYGETHLMSRYWVWAGFVVGSICGAAIRTLVRSEKRSASRHS